MPPSEDRPSPAHWADPFFNARYGVGFNDKVSYDLGGRGPTNTPGQDPAVRQAENSAFLFGRKYPNAGPWIQAGLNTIEGNLPAPGGLPFSATPEEIAGRERGAHAAATYDLPTPPTPGIFTPDTGGYRGEADVTSTTSDFRVDPNVTNPTYQIPSFLTVPTLPEKPSTFDDAFDDFNVSAREGGGYSMGDPFTPGNQLPSDIGAPGSVDPGTYGNRDDLPEFDGNGDCVANCGPTPDSGVNPAAPTPEEQELMDRDRQQNLRDIYGQDPVLQHLLTSGGGGGGGYDGAYWF